jgi:hypothetical protein
MVGLSCNCKPVLVMKHASAQEQIPPAKMTLIMGKSHDPLVILVHVIGSPIQLSDSTQVIEFLKFIQDTY